MRISVINSDSIRYSYQSSYDTYKAYTELEKYYGPYELFSKVTTYFRSTYELPSYIGKGVYNDIDYMIQKMNNKMSQNPNLSKSLFGGGKGNSFSKLYISTLGEMFERIIGALSYYRFKDQFIFGSYNDLKDNFNLYSPDQLFIFAKEQFTEDFLYENFTKDTKIRWVEGEKLLSGKKVYVPAQLIFIFFPFEKENEERIGYATSGGLSLHDNKELALFHGITECIERDAINVRWYNNIPPDIIDFNELNNLSPYGKQVLDHKKTIERKISAYYHNIDLDEFPVVTALSYDQDITKFSFCAGGGVDSTLETAVESSFREYGQSELNLRSLFYNPNWYSSKSMIELFGFEDFDLKNMTLFYEIVPYYGLKKHRNMLNWYISKNNKKHVSKEGIIQISDFKNQYEYLIATLKKYNIEPIIFDLTPKGFNFIRLIKSYIPELTSAFLPNAPCLGHPRFYHLAYENGLSDSVLTFEELNKDPLPFP